MTPFIPTETPGTLEVRNCSGERITGYCFDPEEYHPYCHPVNLPGEVPLTMVRPGDHPWHNGMAFCWKYLNGCNVWDQENSGPKPGKCLHKELQSDGERPRRHPRVALSRRILRGQARSRHPRRALGELGEGLIHPKMKKQKLPIILALILATCGVCAVESNNTSKS